MAPADTPSARAGVSLGYVAGAHGVRGAVRAKLFNVESSTLAPGQVVELRERGAEPGTGERREIVRIVPKPGSDQVRLWLQGVEDRDAADALRGRELWIERDALPDLDDEEFYLVDLIGQPVVRERGGELELLGEVTGVTSNNAQDLLRVRLRGREWLLPVIAPFIIDIDIDARGVVVDVHDEMVFP